MSKKSEILFLDVFEKLEDPRSERNRMYSMSEILLTTLCGVICGAEGWQDIEDFGKSKLEDLRHYLPVKNGIPSDDTFRRFFRGIDPEMFQDLFRHWIGQLIPGFDANIIAIDGKSSRHTFDEASPQRF